EEVTFGTPATCAAAARPRNFPHRAAPGPATGEERPMAVEGTAVTGGHHPHGVMDKGLKKGAISYVSNIVIGVASTAPAYSLAATLGFIVAVEGTGVHAPG